LRFPGVFGILDLTFEKSLHRGCGVVKTKIWIGIFAALLLICAGLSIWFLMPGEDAAMVEIWSDGVLIDTWSLAVDQSITVGYADAYNVVSVKNGKVAVTEATCPDHYCMKRGYCNGGADIVCLPNRLVLKFTGEQEVDFVVG